MRKLEHETCYQAFLANDSRLDGTFFTGVITTGIYCRTICRARKPKSSNCRFFAHASLAERAGFRPCKICRPEQSPGLPPTEHGASMIAWAIRHIHEGFLSDGSRLEDLASSLGVSSRHLRRLFQSETGVSPIQWAQTHRLLTAKRLLAETTLSIADIAMASGFQSLRRCNALFKSVYGQAPNEFRKETKSKIDQGTVGDSIRLSLGYRPPYAWEELLGYFRRRSIPGVEWIEEHSYSRTLRCGELHGWLRVSHLLDRHSIQVEISSSLIPVFAQVLSRVRVAFDLDASPELISDRLSCEPRLRASVQRCPGLRLPGSLESFETAVRTIAGQQISVAAATTVMGRIVHAYGQPVLTPWNELSFLSITPEIIARQSVDGLMRHGLTAARANAILALARSIHEGTIEWDSFRDPQRTILQLQELDGIGPWTANYFAMRILGVPDAFIANDLVVRKQLAPLNRNQIDELSQAWSPWRAYAVMHLWNQASTVPLKPSTKLVR